MIQVEIRVVVDGITVQYEREIAYSDRSQSAINVEKAQELLLEGYYKIKRGIESQK